MCLSLTRANLLKKTMTHVAKMIFVTGLLLGFSQAFAASESMVGTMPDLVTLVEKTGPAVVNIRTIEKPHRMEYSNEAEQQLQEYLFRFFGVRPGGNLFQQAPEVRRGMGSGFITTEDGYILTNTHVVENADEIYVRLVDNREFTAKLIGTDRRTDVALIKIDGNNLPCLKLGKSADIRVGEWVVAIGSPFALENTVTAGIISAKARETGDYLPLIQTDVAVNPGNSGGPLINMRGEVIGINSQIYSRSGGYMGISFAIPIDEALAVSEQLKKSGHVSRGRIGIQISEISTDVANALKLPKKQGVLVNSVDANGSSAKAGILPGDVILTFNGQAVKKINELPRLIGEAKPNSRVTLGIWRKGSSRDVSVVVEAVSEDVGKTSKKEAPSSLRKNENNLGIAVGDLSARDKKELQIKGGVYISALSQDMAIAGLRRGDIILRVNDTDISDSEQFHQVVSGLNRKNAIVFLVQRNDVINFVAVKPAS